MIEVSTTPSGLSFGHFLLGGGEHARNKLTYGRARLKSISGLAAAAARRLKLIPTTKRDLKHKRYFILERFVAYVPSNWPSR